MTVISRLLVKLLNLHITSLAVTKVTRNMQTHRLLNVRDPRIARCGKEQSDFDTAGI